MKRFHLSVKSRCSVLHSLWKFLLFCGLKRLYDSPWSDFFYQSVKGLKLCPPLGSSIVNFQSILSVTPISILYELSFWFQDIQILLRFKSIQLSIPFQFIRNINLLSIYWKYYSVLNLLKMSLPFRSIQNITMFSIY